MRATPLNANHTSSPWFYYNHHHANTISSKHIPPVSRLSHYVYIQKRLQTHNKHDTRMKITALATIATTLHIPHNKKERERTQGQSSHDFGSVFRLACQRAFLKHMQTSKNVWVRLRNYTCQVNKQPHICINTHKCNHALNCHMNILIDNSQCI